MSVSSTSALAFAAAASMLASTSALATVQPTSRDPDIRVIGQPPERLRREVADYVKQVGVVVGDQPAARWVDPVCPRAIGLPPALAARVVAQVRSVAASVGAPLAGSAACEPNLLLTFTENGQDLVQLIAKRAALGEMTHQQRTALQSETGPIRWWYANEVRNGDGSPMSAGGAVQIASAGPYGNYGSFGLTARNGSSNARGASLIAVPTMRTITHATVVIDVNQATGKKLGSVVDYAALVALAEVRPGAAPSDSVLSLFQTAESKRLSRTDVALLKGLYRLPLARKADQQRRSLVTNILNERLNPKSDN